MRTHSYRPPTPTPTPSLRDVLTATAPASDPNGDTLSYAFSWTLNGAVDRRAEAR